MQPRRRRAVLVRVLEYGRVNLPLGVNTARNRERLQKAGVQGGKSAFDIRGRTLHAKGIVGVVDLGDISVEILPKIHDEATPDEGRTFLTDLLRFTAGGAGLAVSKAAVDTGDRSLLEVILSWAARSISDNIRHGLPRKYMAREEVSTTVRGRIDLRKIALAKPGKVFELNVRHAPLVEDNLIARIIRWLARRVSQASRMTSTRQLCQRVLEDCSSVRDIHPTIDDFENVRLQPLEENWASLIQFAKSLVEQKVLNPTQAGSFESISVLFTLHDLFESALRRVFREGMPLRGFSLRKTTSYLLHAEPDDDRPPILRLKPDFRFVTSRSETASGIGDAKWKSIVTLAGRIRLSEDDAYQLSAYLTALGSDTGFLFCPLIGNVNEGLVRTVSWRLTGGGQLVHIMAIHVPSLIAPGAVGMSLRTEVCQLLAETITQTSAAIQL